MTISITAAKSRYAGDGSTTSFPTGFKFPANEHVRVILQRADGSESLWSEGSEYSLTGADLPSGGTVEVATSPVDNTPAAGETLLVKLAVPPRQDISLPLGGAFPSTAVEAMADLAALRDQQIEEALSRAPKLKETTALADVAFPEPEAGRPIGWNAAGDELVNLPGLGRWQGDWAPATQYIALDVLRDPLTKNIYVCEVAHISGTFATDLAAGKWSEAIDVEDVEAAAVAAQSAQAAAESAQAGCATAQSAAAAAASSAANSETNAGNSATAAAGSAMTASNAATAAENAETAAEGAAAAAAASAAQVEDAKLLWRGDWVGATAYAANDAVAHDGASWICIQEHTSQEPPHALYWDVLAAKGTPGTDGADGLGVPSGGITGQVLRKASNTDNDVEWGNPAAAPVDSVFGRSGAVAAQGGDYNADQISETSGGKIMTAAERTKLAGIAAGAEMNPAVPTQNQAEDGTSTTEYSWTPQRVHQAAKDAVPWSLTVAVGDESTEITPGTAKVTFRLPHAVTLTAVRASLTTASNSGAVTIDINENGATILSTKLSVDQSEKTSTTAAIPAVLSDASLADDAEITIDVDGAGSGAAGLKVTLVGCKTTT